MIGSAENRVVAVPLIGDGFIAALSDLVEVLLALEGTDPADGQVPLSALLVDGSGLRALNRLAGALVPTQTTRGPRLLDHRSRALPPVVFVEVLTSDLQLLGHLVQALGLAHLRGAPRVESLLAEIASVSWARPSTTADLIAAFARLHGLLDLAWTDDTAALFEELQAAGAGCAIVELRPDTEECYRRLSRRLSGMWGARSPHQQICGGDVGEEYR
ncbi:hypothetical protein [Pseudonocardia sp. WMMC193]|uniref:hypothetical protein n=1 Tax=Pseudonocardia sp. WMMC193 TaxID=2911965 RepID=UPI001F1B4EDA|nr:hypothetical protein [Pseudonocardia sp. WMMC193]MCF7547158.1 hypothetical protein [Pseudonocardia sp. WMMC193]MCF7547252.1 hypothetical protein [Pseudonocardia sp. WMMC193]